MARKGRKRSPSTHGWCRAEDKMSRKLAASAPFIGFFDFALRAPLRMMACAMPDTMKLLPHDSLTQNDGRGTRRTHEAAKTKSCTHTGVTVE